MDRHYLRDYEGARMILADEGECDPEVPIVNGGFYFGCIGSS
jgi:hypothetical protein